ncbi:MAG: DMT family transporter [Promethearchaeota archaeon]
MDKSQSVGYTAAFLAGLSFGSISIISALLRNLGASSVEQILIRLFFSIMISIGVIFFFYLKNPQEFRSSISYLTQKTYCLQGLFFSLMIILYISSIALETPVGEAVLLAQIHPFITLILAWLLLGEKIDLSKILALLLGITGLVILTRPWEWTSFLSSLIGDLLALFTGIVIAFYLLTGRWSARHRANVSSELSIAWVLCWGFLLGVPILLFLTLLPLPVSLVGFSLDTYFSFDVLLLGLLFAVLGSFLPYGLVMVSSNYIESSKGSILLLSEPIGVIILGALILGEEITIWYIAGGIALLLAIIIVILSSKDQQGE